MPLTRHMRSRRRKPGDRGATLILFALLITAMVVLVALVIDYGFVRNTRQDDKRTADAVALAGTGALAPDAVSRPWRGVCKAFSYLKVNQPDRVFSTVEYLDGLGAPSSVANPCASSASLNTPCIPKPASPSAPTTWASTWAWLRVSDGDMIVDIKSGYQTPDPSFPEDSSAYTSDDGFTSAGGCDQIAVIVAEGDPAFFGGVAGASGYETRARSVGRAVIDPGGPGVPAFLILERTKCDAISESVGSGAGIIVQPNGTDPGIIHSDSAGSPATGCDGSNNSAGWAIFSSGSSGPRIQALPTVATATTPSKPGKISVNALEIGNPPAAYGGPVDKGLSPNPVAGGIVSRKPVDDKYNPSGQFKTLHENARRDIRTSTGAVRTTPLIAPAGLTQRTLACSDDTGTFSEDYIFVNCADYKPNDVTFSNAVKVMFNGWVQVANNKQLWMPNATSIVVGGNSSRGLEVNGGGRLGINSRKFGDRDDSVVPTLTDADRGVRAACAGREGADGWSRRSTLVIFGGGNSGAGEGALNVGGRAALCQTFAYLAGPTSDTTYTRYQIDDKTYASSCTETKPCPSDATGSQTNARLVISGLLRWSAPNEDPANDIGAGSGFEDLALWSESSKQTTVSSGGKLEVQGALFLPNARVDMSSPAVVQPLDAQFIARSLTLRQGALTMKPTRANAIKVPLLESSGLVR